MEGETTRITDLPGGGGGGDLMETKMDSSKTAMIELRMPDLFFKFFFLP